VEESETGPEPEVVLDEYLANIDITDSIGLYLKEVSQVPLLTATEEVELAQCNEHGRMAREELARGEQILLFANAFFVDLYGCMSSEYLGQKPVFAKRHSPDPKPLYFHCLYLQILQASCL
jgi:hypothetical protein